MKNVPLQIKKKEFLNPIEECWNVVKGAMKCRIIEIFETMLSSLSAGVKQSKDYARLSN